MQPDLDERQSLGRLALRDLVLVVREDQVDPTGMNVECGAEVAHAHRGALDVPAGAARAERRLPRGLARLRRLPQDEVADVVLRVLIGLDALPNPELIRVEPRQPAVGGQGRDPEEDRAVVGPVRVLVFEERRDEVDDLRDVLGRTRQDVGTGRAKRVGVLEEPLEVAVGE